MDRIAAALAQHNIAIEPQTLRTGYDGNLFRVGEAEIIYRIDDDDRTVVIPRYHRHPSVGLHNALAELLWFFDLLAEERFQLDGVKALMRSDGQSEGRTRLSTARLSALCQRVLGARTLEWDGGEEWLYVDLREYARRR